MNVAVMGFYGYGNTGDELMLRSIRNLLQEHKVVAIPTGFRATDETIERLNQYDFVLLGGGSLFAGQPPAPFDKFDLWGSALRVPVGILGVGVSEIWPEARQATDCLIDASQFFLVRDENSARILANSKVELAPDLTYLSNTRLGLLESEDETTVIGVNLRPIGEDLNPWIEAIRRLAGIKKPLPFSRYVGFDDCLPLQKIEQSCPESFHESQFESISIVIGMAFHSVVLATQANLPTIAINYSSKVKTFMQEAGLGDYVLELNEPSRLQELYITALQDKESIKERLSIMNRRNQQLANEAYGKCVRHIEKCGKERDSRIGNEGHQKPIQVIVNGQSSSYSDLQQTIRSCLDQHYRPLKVNVILDKSDLQRAATEYAGSEITIHEQTENDIDWLRIAAKETTCDFVTALSAGEELVVDGLETLARTLCKRGDVDVALAGVFSMWRGRIEWSLSDNPFDAEVLGNLKNCCFLARKAALSERIHGPSNAQSNRKKRRSGQVLLVIPDYLGGRPSSKKEHLMLASTFAYWHCDAPRGWLNLEEALSLTPVDYNKLANEFATSCVAIGYSRRLRKDPVEYWRSVAGLLADDDRIPLTFRKTVVADILLESVYVLASRGKLLEAIVELAKAIRSDVRVAGNRGVWKMIVLAAWKKLV